MTRNEWKKWVRERDKMLAARSPEKLREFVNKHSELYEAAVVTAINTVSDDTLILMIHKMTMDATSISQKYKTESERWLKEFYEHFGKSQQGSRNP